MHRNVVNRDKAWPYIVTAAPVSRPVALAEVKTHLIIDLADTTEDAYLNALIDTVVQYAEKYTKRDLISRTYETYRDTFYNSLEIRRTPLQSVTKVEYLKDDVLTTVAATVYFVTLSSTFSHLSLRAGQVWPTDIDSQEQAIKITFTAGFGNTSVPQELKTALLHHIAALYENRGDCDEDRVSMKAQALLPVDTQLIYDQFRIRSI